MKMSIDFRNNSTVVNNQAVEFVQKYKHLGAIIDNRLTFEPHVDAVCGKVHQRMYFCCKL